MPLYAFTIALSAFLLFLVQPIVARQILPWFGGSAAVWTTCMMFFQAALLAGYAYSDLIVRRFDARRQRWLHAVLLLASLAWLPIVLNDAWRPAPEGAPVLQIVVLLAAGIGLPYFMLSTTGPLLQAWFAQRYPEARVYRLYALSNAASMTALVAYPPLIEPAASVPVQALVWSVGYGLFAAAGLLLIWRAPGFQAVGRSAKDAIDTVERPPGPGVQFTWFGYSALGSVLLLSVTAHLTQNVASVPFLWLLPLTLYLLSFILCFDGRGWYRPTLFRVLAGLSCVLMAAGFFARLGPGWAISLGSMPILQGIGIYGVGLFVLCMFLHGELAEKRPSSTHLTRFYLMLALGGAGGGVFVAVVAGLIFNGYVELPLALCASAFVLLFSVHTERARFLSMLICVATLVCAVPLVYNPVSGALASSRNFYGVLKVRKLDSDDPERARLRLSHGNTVHGEQFVGMESRRLPTSYYGPKSGIGRTIEWFQENEAGRHRVGVIGLGTGTLASYGRTGDLYRFYEIDPMVASYADYFFSYLKDSAATNEVRLGDGRLMLEAEAPNAYQMLVVDAFSSDAIPMHLLTVEAMRVYTRHVTKGGAVVINISNRYLDLRPVLRHLADAVGWSAIVMDGESDESQGVLASRWVILTEQGRLVDALRAWGGKEAVRDDRVRGWTDSYGNLFQVISGLR